MNTLINNVRLRCCCYWCSSSCRSTILLMFSRWQHYFVVSDACSSVSEHSWTDDVWCVVTGAAATFWRWTCSSPSSNTRTSNNKKPIRPLSYSVCVEGYLHNIFSPHRMQSLHRCGILLQASWSVCLSVWVCHTRELCRTAEYVEMPFGVRQTRMGQRSQVFTNIIDSQTDVMPFA